MDEYLTFLPAHAVNTAIVFVAGWFIKRGVGRRSEARRVHGEFVYWWAAGGYLAGGLLSPLTGADGPMGMAGTAGFSLLAGWLVGTVHGALVLLWRRSNTPPAP